MNPAIASVIPAIVHAVNTFSHAKPVPKHATKKIFCPDAFYAFPS